MSETKQGNANILDELIGLVAPNNASLLPDGDTEVVVQNEKTDRDIAAFTPPPEQTEQISISDYDLKYEVGMENYYDTLASQAQLLASEFKDLELLAMGQELARLIRTIPYNHDHFYKVSVQAKAIENRILMNKAKSREVIFIEEDDGSKSAWSFDKAYYNNQYEFSAGIYREDKKYPRGESCAKNVVAYFQSQIPPLETLEYDRDIVRGPGYTEIYEEYRLDGKLVYCVREHIHENGDHAQWTYLLVDDAEKALENWQNIITIVNKSRKA